MNNLNLSEDQINIIIFSLQKIISHKMCESNDECLEIQRIINRLFKELYNE